MSLSGSYWIIRSFIPLVSFCFLLFAESHWWSGEAARFILAWLARRDWISLKCSWNKKLKSGIERSKEFKVARHAEGRRVSTHAAEPRARPSSKTWLYLATARHCCTFCSNPTSKVIIAWTSDDSQCLPPSDDNYAVSWSTEYTADYLFIVWVFILTGGRAGEVGGEWQRHVWGGLTEGAREVMREIEFAGCVWDRFAWRSCKCVFCLHVCACHSFWLCFCATFRRSLFLQLVCSPHSARTYMALSSTSPPTPPSLITLHGFLLCVCVAFYGEELIHRFLRHCVWWHIHDLDEVARDVNALQAPEHLPCLPSQP